MSAYVCRVCGAEFSGPYVRCIGEDGLHVPTVPSWRWFWVAREVELPDPMDRYSVRVGRKIIAASLPYDAALRLAQRTKGSRTQKDGS